MQTRAVFLTSVLLLLLAGCAPTTVTPGEPLSPTPSLTPIPQPTAPPEGFGLWIAPAAPDGLRRAALAAGLPVAHSPETALVRLDASPLDPQFPTSQSTWIYALVAPFPTVSDGVSFEQLRQAWAGQQPSVFAGFAGKAGKPLLAAPDTYEALKSIFNGDAAQGAVRIVPAGELAEALWQDTPQWGIVPFEALDPKLKVLTIDGQSPLRNDFDPATYPLKATFNLRPATPDAGAGFSVPTTNRDPARLTTVLMTGTSALVRAIAFRMEEKGLTYPGRDLRGWLRGADVLHVSHEVALAETCPPPSYDTHDLRFCGRPEYIKLFEDVGVDVVEVTGNHVNNWDVWPFADTLEMYTARGWSYFGGGVDLADAREPALLEHGGTKLAFIGCNVAGPPVAFATETLPGAADCGNYAWITEAIRDLRARGYIVIATQQYGEYYQPKPTENQVRDFARLAEAGATVVSGSQAHYPQTMTFSGDAFIHYGLGNLFFDQMSYQLPHSGEFTYRTRDEFLDRHVFYDGKYIGLELLTATLEDHSRPRPMTPAERAEFLEAYFRDSGW